MYLKMARNNFFLLRKHKRCFSDMLRGGQRKISKKRDFYNEVYQQNKNNNCLNLPAKIKFNKNLSINETYLRENFSVPPETTLEI
jgi:hypothetical protein